ncbi:MAG TPA: hypothetical protein VFZ32_07300 [Micromonosporaceae bacterium]|jgi:hypothetical protein
MPETYFGNPEATRSGGRDLAAVGDRLTESVNKHLDTIKGIEAGNPWGNDEPGQRFANGDNGNGYVAASQGFAEAAPGVGENVSGLGDAVVGVVDLTQGTDQTNAQNLNVT